MKLKKTIALLLAAVMLLSMLAACGSSDSSTEETTETEEVEEVEEEEEAEEETAEEETAEEAAEETAEEAVEEVEEETASLVSYPLGDGSEVITFWTTIPGNQVDLFPDGYNDHFMIDYVESALGVDLEITSVSQVAMDDNTQYNLMIASGDWPDLLATGNYSGGISQAAYDEVIIELTEDMLSTYAPDYYELLMSLDDQYIRATQVDGSWYGVYNITSGEGASASRGMVIRTDWLDELGMDIPTSVDELTDVLKAFKDTYDPTYTYFIEADADLVYLCAAFDTNTVGYYNGGELPLHLEDGEVIVSWVTDEYRAFLDWFIECYEYGIFEPSFYQTASDQSGDRYAYLLAGEIGIYEDSPTSIADWQQYAMEGETVEVSFFPNIVSEDGTNKWGDEQEVIGTHLSVSATCENPELALQVMNYFYTDEGATLANYGVEGYTFNYTDDGDVEYTELLMDSEYQLSMRALHGIYSWNLFPYLTYSDALYPMYTDEVLEALEIMSTDGITAEHFYPSAISLTTDESGAITTMVADITTYSQETLLKFMTGATELNDENWEAYIEQLYAYGLQDCIDVYQNAYDEYMAGER